MASGDTKTEAMLNVLGNGGSGDEFRGCCNTKTQQYILDAIDRVQNVEDEVERLENNPDVVDIVATYQDLQDYDTSGLTDKDIIRVLQDETHDGNSTYYRWNAATNQFDFVGEIAGGSGITELTANDYNYPANNPTSVAHWLLEPGLYVVGGNSGISFSYSSSSTGTVSPNTLVVVSRSSSGAFSEMLVGENGSWSNYSAQANNGSPYAAKTGEVLLDARIKQATGTSTTDVMSQKAVTDALASAGGAAKELTADDYNWNFSSHSAAEPYDSVALWLLPAGIYDVPNDNIVAYIADNSIYRAYTGLYVVSESSSYGKSIVHLVRRVDSDGTTYGRVYGVSNSGSFLDSIYIKGAVQTTGTSTTDVMSQNAVTSMVFADPASKEQVRIGANTDNRGSEGISIGKKASITTNAGSVAIGGSSKVSSLYSVALGYQATATRNGEVNIGSGGYTAYGYNNTAYRVLGGVHDPVDAHDAATKGYVDGKVLQNAGAPTTSTVGTVGQLLEDTTNGKLYQCTAVSGNTYTWTEVGAGGGASGFTNGGTTAPTSATQGSVGDVYSYVDRSGSIPEPHVMVSNGALSGVSGEGNYDGGADLTSSELTSASSLQTFATQALNAQSALFGIQIVFTNSTTGIMSDPYGETLDTATVTLSQLASNGLDLSNYSSDIVSGTTVDVDFGGEFGSLATSVPFNTTDPSSLLSFMEQETGTTVDLSQGDIYPVIYAQDSTHWDLYFPDESATPVTVTPAQLNANGLGLPATSLLLSMVSLTFSQLSGYQWIDVVNTVVENRLNGLTIVSISQTDYDNLQTKDPNTLYIITGA